MKILSAFESATEWSVPVKQIMEEAVTRKFVHEDSSHIVSFCGEVYFFDQKKLPFHFKTDYSPALFCCLLLTVGPCALEYTKMKTADHFWTDPSADELVQRHRIHSGICRQDSPTKRPALCIQKRHSSSSMDERPSPSPSAREYVESLHQNSRATLLFGKNNVLVQPRDDMEAIPGYLSLHQTADLMTLKWTPNQLMNGSVADLDYERSVYWDYAMTINFEEIVYLHCHQQVDSGGTVVLVSQDGIQRPPLRFPRGGHLLQFLSCLENGLLPHGQLDPPLWSQRGKGKVFPKLRKRVPVGSGSTESVSDKEEDEATDYVFRIIFPNSLSDFRTPPDLMDQGAALWQPTLRKPSCSSCSQGNFSDEASHKGCNYERTPLKLLCDNMKYQIISRAFYGWLAYCRHLSTVRTHLSALVNHTIVATDVPCDATGGLTTDVWQTFLKDCTTYKEQELLRLVYFGGVDPSLRKEVWPFLLGHYQFGMSEDNRREVDEQVRASYQQTMSEWLACEEVVREREKEQHAAALAKCSSVASVDSSSQRMTHHDSTVSNESHSSHSSDRESLARLQSDSSSSTQVFESVEEVEQPESESKTDATKQVPKMPNEAVQNESSSPDSGHPSSRNFSITSGLSDGSFSTEDSSAPDASQRSTAAPLMPQISTKPAGGEGEGLTTESQVAREEKGKGEEGKTFDSIDKGETTLHPGTRENKKSDKVKKEESSFEDRGLKMSVKEMISELYLLNYWYFTPANLEKLRNVMCSYIWRHLDIGYVQGMCDLLAPLLVILDDEAKAFSCFSKLMKRMNQNFPHGGAMDTHFANMRSLIQILDAELFELMHQNGDYTHFYFCYRWFLLDFKRELVYDDVFAVWETIWAAKYASSGHFVLFIALALVEVYRDIILENNMDFTDIIKFFNEMAEHHNIKQILTLARDLVCKVQLLIENK
uniref:Small G protein signaling modulator 1-like n=1 Tax=Cyprinodon variegatus TaxID=28743 RepID=A0A3Q2FGP7_CYPVA